MKIGEAVYSARGRRRRRRQAARASSAEKSSGEENVVDADFEEVKDDKKKSA